MDMLIGGSLAARILVVDDEPANVRLLERMLDLWGYECVVSTTKSDEVIGLCREAEPDLILMDLHMPGPDGFDLLEQLQPWRRGRTLVPIVVLTADQTRPTRERALALGATEFLTKPFDATEARLRVANLLEIRRLNLELRTHNDVLEKRVVERTREVERARFETLDRLALAAEYRDDATQQHARRVGRTAARIAAELGRPTAEIELIRRAAPLHDLGKIGISDSILLKPAKLTTEEFAEMKRHTLIGAQILAGSHSRVLQLAEVIALNHHERWDGTGYPAGVESERTPLVARIVGLADVFDTLTHERPYKHAWPLEEALEELHVMSGSHLDPQLVAVFDTLRHEELLAPIGDGSRG